MNVTLLPAVAQLVLLEQRKISPLELAEEHIRQIERLNPALNAIIDFDAISGASVGDGVIQLRDLLRGAGYERRAVHYERW